MLIQDEEERVEQYKFLIEKLPNINQILIKRLLSYLMQVSSNSVTNKMNTEALSIVFGQMANVFTSNAGQEMLNWAIKRYPLIYEVQDMQDPKYPLFLRKLVGHRRSVYALIRYQNFIFSFDSTGLCRIWDSVNYHFVKSFSTSCGSSSFASPIITNQKLYIICNNSLLRWNLSEIFNAEVPVSTTVCIPDVHVLAHFIDYQNDLWLAGTGLSVYDELNGTNHVLEPVQGKTLFHNPVLIKNNVWILKDKFVQVWDAVNRKLIFQFGGSEMFPSGHVPNRISPVGENVWIAGFVGKDGIVWIIDPTTYQVLNMFRSSTGELYDLKVLGSLVWGVSWDACIHTWEKTGEYVADIRNLHRDAIRMLLPISRPEGDGWVVWTGSSDSTINVMFVPINYTSTLYKFKNKSG
eukprot:TRINITY_DN5549_c2_g1_i1.p1 TRINITY_DN5549_c2_g1~~TRINITY_DN5549_c2_g1_i1.p1  ORF type:complete len:407 (-),score=76.81 TRINITY_DN5549_c2_g1_i1:663-1883(-)